MYECMFQIKLNHWFVLSAGGLGGCTETVEDTETEAIEMKGRNVG